MELPKGYFKIISRFNNKEKVKLCIDLNGGMADNGTEIIVYKSHNGLQQLWKYDNGLFINLIVGKVLDVVNNKVIINTLSGELSQKWSIDTVGRIQSNLTKQYLTFEEVNSGAVFLMHELKSNTQKWYFDMITLTPAQQENIKNTLLKNNADELTKSLDKYKKANGLSTNIIYTPEELAKRAEDIKTCATECASGIDKKTLKIPQSDKTIYIPHERLPKFSGVISIQTWIKINKFVHTSEYKPIFYISNIMGLWLYPQTFKLFTHYDANIIGDIKLGEWFNIVEIYRDTYLKVYLNNRVILDIEIDRWTEQKFNMTIINDTNINVGTLFFSNYEIDPVLISERWHNSIYNQSNNPYYTEYSDIKKKYDKLLIQHDLLKHSRCPPVEKCIAPINVIPSDTNVIKLSIEEYNKVMKLEDELRLCKIRSNNSGYSPQSTAFLPNNSFGSANGSQSANLSCPAPICPMPSIPACPAPTCPAPTCPAPTCPKPTCPKPTCPAPTCPAPTCPKPTCPNPTCPVCPKLDYSEFNNLKQQYTSLLGKIDSERQTAVNKYTETKNNMTSLANQQIMSNAIVNYKAEIDKLKNMYITKVSEDNKIIQNLRQENMMLTKKISNCNANFK